MNNWITKPFRDIATFPPKVSLEKEHYFSFIPMDVVNEGYKYVSPKEFKKWTGSGGAKFENGDTLFARITPCLQNGKIAQAKNLPSGKGFGSTEFFVFRGKENVSDSDFIYYLAKTDDFRSYAIGSMVGASGRQRADATYVGNYEVNLPPLPTQKRIASILSTYDDLIENNLKRIKLLEEIAQRTYEEWFVKFRVNGEQLAIDEATGLPVGWVEREFDYFGNVITGKTPSTLNRNNFDGEIQFVKTPDMSNYPYVVETTQCLSLEGAKTQIKKYIPKNSLMISCIGSAGEFALASEECQTNQQINSIVFYKEYYTFYFYCFAKGLKPLLEAIGSNGATMTNVNKGKFEKILIKHPEESYLIRFHDIAQPCFDQILCLLKQNQKLKQSRDILLPRLMSGTINVES
jgi:type I restriction enzyme, S subunit